MIPTGPDTKAAFTEGFFQVAAAQNPKPQTAALVAADAEFSDNACEGARENAKKYGFKIVYDKTYPPPTTDFSPIVRAIQATNPDIVVVCSYPLDSVGMVKAVNEVGFKPKMIGGAMVGLQATVFKNQLGPLLNGFVNYETWVPDEKMIVRQHRRLLQEVSGARRRRRRRSARLLSRRMGLCLHPGSRRCRAGDQKPQRRQARRLHRARPRSRPSWAISRSARAANGTRAACCRCSTTASSRAPASNMAGHGLSDRADAERLKTGNVIYPYEKAKM